MRSCTRSTLLALVLACGALSAAPPCAAQAINAEAQAVVRFNRGRQMFLAQDYQHALDEFRAALSLVGSPNTRLYIGRCLHALNRNAEALVEFQRAGAEAADRASREPRYAGTRDAARTEAASVEPLVGTLIVRVRNAPAGATVTVNGTPVPSGAWDVPIPFDPGSLEIAATGPGFEAFHQTAAVTAQHETAISIELHASAAPTPAPAQPTPAPVDHGTPAASATPAHTPEGTSATPAPLVENPEPQTHGGGIRTAGIGVIVVGVLGAGAGGIFGYLAQSRYNELRMQCGQTGCGSEYDSRISEGQTDQLIANVGLVAGGVLLVVGAVMVAVGGPTTDSPGANTTNGAGNGAGNHASRRGRHWAVWGVPSVDANGGMVGVSGAF